MGSDIQKDKAKGSEEILLVLQDKWKKLDDLIAMLEKEEFTTAREMNDNHVKRRIEEIQNFINIDLKSWRNELSNCEDDDQYIEYEKKVIVLEKYSEELYDKNSKIIKRKLIPSLSN